MQGLVAKKQAQNYTCPPRNAAGQLLSHHVGTDDTSRRPDSSLWRRSDMALGLLVVACVLFAAVLWWFLLR